MLQSQERFGGEQVFLLKNNSSSLSFISIVAGFFELKDLDFFKRKTESNTNFDSVLR